MIRAFSLCFLLIIIFSSCDPDRVYDNYQSLPGYWEKDSIISFEIKGLDSIQNYDLFINLRNTNQYEYSNIYLITTMNFPYGKVIEDTLEYQMAFPSGEWMGVGIGEAKSSKLWYKKNIRFEEPGPYHFEIRHAMRKNNQREGIEKLKGITEVGLRIEKTK